MPRDPLCSYTTNRYLSGYCVFHSISRRIPERVDDTDENIIACAIDGAAAMVGKYRGFTAF